MILSKMIALLVCCSAVCRADWPTYHGDASLKGVGEAKPGDGLELAWRYNAGGAVYGTPVSDGERIYFTAKRGRVVALGLDGTRIWEKTFFRKNDAGKDMPLRFEAPLVCADGMVFAGTTRGALIALDAKTGNEKWRYETDGIITGSPNILDPGCKDAKTQRKENRSDLASSRSKLVVLDQSEGALHCVDMGTGKRLWKTEGVERCDGAPGVGEAHIVFGSCLAALHVYDRRGAHLRNIEIGGDGQIAGGVAVDGTRAYAGLRDGALICADLATGDIIWISEESKEQTFTTPAVTKGFVVYGSDNGFVYAVEPKEGKTVWKFDTGGLPYSPVVAGDRVAVSADGELYLLRLADGLKVWSKEISDDITAPAVIHGRIVVGADDGTVTAWGAPLP